MNQELTVINEEFPVKEKFNSSISLSKEDLKNKVKIYCQESYAQDLYNLMAGSSTLFSSETKDLKRGELYKVKARSISYVDRAIIAEEVSSGVTISVPFREYSRSLDDLRSGKNIEFLVNLFRVEKNGEYYGSEKKALSATHRQSLFEHLEKNTWFEVKIKKLIRGGYLAIYMNEIECFLPGSHAAANIIHNFNDLLGKTINVMVDNYDSANDLFILSYKKYVTESMSTKISDLEFNKKYTGVLTNNPYDFGMFVEIDGYYTGLIHKTEFENYEDIRKKYRVGQKIEVYVKDITMKGDQYRVILTLDSSQVNTEKIQWQEIKNRTENQVFSYVLNENKNSILINVDGENLEVSFRRKEVSENLNNYPMVKISKVDHIRKKLNFEFVEQNF
jgi:ribosomal protein S1